MIRAQIQTLTGKEKLSKVAEGVYSLEGKEYWVEDRQWLKDNGIHYKRIKSTDMEKRVLNTEFREFEGTTEGFAAVFNSTSEDLGGFIERIAPGAFDNVLNDDVRALINHDPNMILGRTTSGTLQIEQTEEGLRYSYTDPDTTYSNDLKKSMKRGDVTQSSFSFSIADGGDEWEQRDGKLIRTITKFGRLYDVSPVTYPAYPDTTVATRSLEMRKADEEKTALELKQKEEIKKDEIKREEILRSLALSDK